MYTKSLFIITMVIACVHVIQHFEPSVTLLSDPDTVQFILFGMYGVWLGSTWKEKE